MRYCCTNCNYVYDESLWDIEEWISSWTMFYDLGDYFYCPVCYEWAENFEIIKEEVNYIENENTNDYFEIEHFPKIKIENSILKVSVWRDNKHIMSENHYIKSISLCDEYWDLIEEKFLNSEDKSEVDFEFYDLDEFEIHIKCNIHWIWWLKIKNK